jgi:hypothetical protein
MEPSQPGEKSSRWVVFRRKTQERPRRPQDRIIVIDMKDGTVLRAYRAADEPIADALPPLPLPTP